MRPTALRHRPAARPRARRTALRLVALLACLASWTGAFALDLSAAYVSALAVDSRVAAARAQLAAIRERVVQARALDLPQAGMAGRLGREYLDIDDGDPARRYSPLSYGVTLAYPLYRPENAVVLDASRLQVSIAALQLDQVQQDLAVRVARAYFDTLASLDSLRTVRAQNRAIAEQYESARRRFEAGATTITDQQEAQARLDLGRSQEVSASNELAVRRALLARIVGQPITDLAILRRGVVLAPPRPDDANAWVDEAAQRNLLVRQAAISNEVAQREIARARLGHRPTVDLVTSASQGRSVAQTTIGNETTAAGIALQFNLPLYQGGAIDSRVRESIALEQRSQHDVETARRDAQQLAQALYLTVGSGLEQVRALEAAERSSQVALESNQIGYRVGGRINIDVLNAQQQLFTTRRDLARARYDVLVASLSLLAAAGRLDTAALAEVNALLTDGTR